MCKYQKECKNPVIENDKCIINELSCFEYRQIRQKSRSQKALSPNKTLQELV